MPLENAMTRINLVDPRTLHSKHLLAEYRELPRVFKLVEAAQARGLSPSTIRIPPTYVLGTGHVTFFYDKLQWLERRFLLLVAECLKRGFNIQYIKVPKLADYLDAHWWNNYEPTPEAIALNVARVKDRMPNDLQAYACGNCS